MIWHRKPSHLGSCSQSSPLGGRTADEGERGRMNAGRTAGTAFILEKSPQNATRGHRNLSDLFLMAPFRRFGADFWASATRRRSASSTLHRSSIASSMASQTGSIARMSSFSHLGSPSLPSSSGVVRNSTCIDDPGQPSKGACLCRSKYSHSGVNFVFGLGFPDDPLAENLHRQVELKHALEGGAVVRIPT
jgi:hypothetical protein